MKYLIIGSGRAALSFTAYFTAKEIAFASWSRASQQEFDLKNFSDCSHILLLISDSAIENFYRGHLSQFSGTVVHCSGALEIPGIYSFHPLATFTRQPVSVSEFEKIHFVTTYRGNPSEILPGLQNPTHQIFSVEKAKYHSLCVMAGNFSVILWQKFFLEMKRMGLPPAAAEQYLEMIFKNIRENPQSALTGPLARKDNLTLQKNLRALDSDPFQEIYASFVHALYPELFSPQSKEIDL